MRNRKRAVVGKECVACGCCVKSCPVGAISIYKGMYAVVDEARCVGCGRCAKACPADVITVREQCADFADAIAVQEGEDVAC